MQKLSEIIGQEKIKTFFLHAVRLKKIPHALMLTGDAGSGKYSLAKAFAMNILCETVSEGKTPEACCSCHACKQVLYGKHPDFIELVKEKENIISVEEIRTQINATSVIRPYQAQKKVYIINDADKMSAESQNTLLKTLEEPPDYVSIFLLTKNEEVMLETIKSRCIKLRTAPLSQHQVRSYLRSKYDLKEDLITFATIYSNGLIGRAVEFVEDINFREQYLQDISMLEELPFMHLDELYVLAQEINKAHKNMEEFFTLFRRWYKDILIYKNKEAYGKIDFRSQEFSIAKIAEKISLLQINHIFQSLDLAESRLRSNVNKDLTLQMFLMECLL